MAIRQTFIYACDVKDCSTPPKTTVRDVRLEGAAERACVPDGWRYTAGVGVTCRKCNEALTRSILEFFRGTKPQRR